MKTVYLLRYSQLTQSNMLESVKAFAKHTGIDTKKIGLIAHQQGGSPSNVYKPEEMEKISQGAIYLFKTGKINDVEFVDRMNKAMGINLSFDIFKECWNAMCTIQPATLDFLRQLSGLQQQRGFGIHVISSTNAMHAKYISDQLVAAGINLDLTQTFSFETGTLAPAAPKIADAKWEDSKFIDLRDAEDIIAKIKLSRYTVVLLPPPEVAEKIEVYARKPEFDQYAQAITGEKLYRLGVDPETGEHRKAHLTVAQFECSEEDFLQVINFLRGQVLSHLTATLAGYNQFPVPPKNASYPPAFDEELTWVDRDVARGGGLQQFNEKLVAFLNTLPGVKVQDLKTDRKTVNGVVDGYRPHFTLFKAFLGDKATLPAMPKMEGIPSTFGVKVAVGESKLTGEFLAENLWGMLDKGQYVPVNKNIDFSPFDTLAYRTSSNAATVYQNLPGLSAFTARLPSMQQVVDTATNVVGATVQAVRNRLPC